MKVTDYVYSKEEFSAHQNENSSDSYYAFVPLFSKAVMPLMGIMGGGFYYHNMSLGIIQNS